MLKKWEVKHPNDIQLMLLTYIFLLSAVALGTASNIFAKEADGFTKLFPSF